MCNELRSVRCCVRGLLKVCKNRITSTHLEFPGEQAPPNYENVGKAVRKAFWQAEGAPHIPFRGERETRRSHTSIYTTSGLDGMSPSSLKIVGAQFGTRAPCSCCDDADADDDVGVAWTGEDSRLCILPRFGAFGVYGTSGSAISISVVLS